MYRFIIRCTYFSALLMLIVSCTSIPSTLASPHSVVSPSSPTITPSSPPTVIPTYSPEETEKITMNWLQNNNNCRLPCLIGITPGITTVQERQNLFAWFGKVEKPGFRTGLSDHKEFALGIRNMVFSERDLEAFVSLTYHEKNGFIEQVDFSAHVTREHQEVFGDPLMDKIVHYYLLPQILSKYGPPSSILIGAWHEDPFLKQPYTEFSMVLVYYDLGFMIEYISPAEFDDDVIQGCPSQAYVNLWTWAPEEKPTLAEILSKKVSDTGILSLSIDYFKPIEQVTSLTVKDFYETFKKQGVSQCLETPANLWPNPNKP